MLIVVAVVLGVSGTLKGAWEQLAVHDWRLRPGWAVAAGTIYVVGLAPMAWFWGRALAALGQVAPAAALLRGYYLGHLGKYVPGKALVIVLRVATIRRTIHSTWLAVVGTLLETLTMMAVGAFLAALLAIVILPMKPGLVALTLLMAIGAGATTLPPLARRLAGAGLAILGRQERELSAEPVAETDEITRSMSWRLSASGWLAAALCWTMLGWSLWATLRAMGVESLQPLADLPLLVGAVSLSVVAGFLSLLPGGILVRDALLMQLLAPRCGEANALIAAVLLRLVWLVSELAVCGILKLMTNDE